MATKKIRNKTKVPQSIVFRGRQIVLGPDEQSLFDSEVADHFIKNRNPLVEEVQEEADLYDDNFSEMVWIANFSGNDSLPETINVKQWAGGKWYRADVPNPLRIPITVERWCDGGMESYTAKDGAFESKNLAPIRFRLPPYTRKMFPKNLAAWSLRRDGTSEIPGRIRRSRAPSAFEPNETWSLDDVRSYLRLIDPSAEVGPAEIEVARRAESDPNAVKAGKSGIGAYVDSAKTEVLRRVFFRVADPRYTLPTREEFNEFTRGEVPVEVSDSDAVMGMISDSTNEVAKVKRGRGRPPGSKNKPKVGEAVT
tara:strand:+ start:777 stop:1706 length:930 start_codon:yes stop_codon:yes gene_type:complete